MYLLHNVQCWVLYVNFIYPSKKKNERGIHIPNLYMIKLRLQEVRKPASN